MAATASVTATAAASPTASALPVLTAAVVILLVVVWLRRRSSSSSAKTTRRTAAAAATTKSVEELLAAADPEQKRMMAERCILLDDDDNVVGHASKRECHEMVNIRKGMLHRAFSVFMFNSEGKLLLQKRSPEKVTFPHYWANTCCSHPLYTESELNGKEGVINAARRKLEQELGINPEDVPASCFQFLTRVHYQAASDGVWGEHEIDYILVCRPPSDPVVRRNPNEVAEVRYFDPAELRSWVQSAETRGDLVSPWFRIIERTLLHRWWDAVMAGDVSGFVDNKIHRAGDFDKEATSSTAGAGAGAGASTSSTANSDSPDFRQRAGVSPGTGAGAVEVKKQGAYGKVRTHKDGVLKQLWHMDEIVAGLRYKLLQRRMRKAEAGIRATMTEDDIFCDAILVSVSRSFAAVIQQLPFELRRAVCVFYLVLRALDTVEDDMTAFEDVSVKVKELRAFAGHLEDPEWTMSGVGEGDEARLLREFGGVVRTFQLLPEPYQRIIRNITERMAEGMARFIQRDLAQGTANTEEYDLYCHYVAGLVGEGLSKLFSASHLEAPEVASNLQLSNDMGLFLQKTNIIRDYLEDFVDARAFWPKDVWSKYADDLGAFAHGANQRAGLACLNELVTNALSHAPMCLRYMAQLKNARVFKFCSIPQVMAIATLERVYNNPKVFTGVVKIRKGTAAKLIMSCNSMADLYTIFLDYSRRIAAAVPADAEPEAAAATLAACAKVEAECLRCLPPQTRCNPLNIGTAVASIAFACTTWMLHGRSKAWDGHMPRITDSMDVLMVAIAAACVVYLLAFSGVSFVLSLKPGEVSGQREVPSSKAQRAHLSGKQRAAAF